MSKVSFVSVVGWSGSGKTTLISKAIEECRRRGIIAGAAKRARHDADVALEGKDSSLFLKAGAVASLYVGDHSTARFEASPALQDRAFYERLLPGAAIVFLEGASVEGAIRVLVAGGARHAGELKRPISECDILVSREDIPAEGLPAPRLIHPDSIGDLVDFLEAQYGS